MQRFIRRIMIGCSVFLAFSMFTSWVVFAQDDRTWNNSSNEDNEFLTESNWAEGSVPTSSENAIFNLSETYDVEFPGAAESFGLHVVGGDVTFRGNGQTYDIHERFLGNFSNLIIDDLRLAFKGADTVADIQLINGSATLINGTAVTFDHPSRFRVSNATLAVDGDGTSVSAGYLEIGEGGDQRFDGYVSISDGANVDSEYTILNSGTISVSGPNSVWTNPGSISRSELGGSTTIEITGGGKIAGAASDVSVDRVEISGSTSQLTGISNLYAKTLTVSEANLAVANTIRISHSVVIQNGGSLSSSVLERVSGDWAFFFKS